MRYLLPLCAVMFLACGGTDDGNGGGDGGANTTDAGPGMDAVPGPDATITGGCGVAPSVTGTSVETTTIAGTERSYTLVVPSGYDQSKAYPLVFAWHGRGSTSGQARAYFGVEGAAAGAAFFVYPQGLGQSSPQDTGWDLSLSGGVDIELFDFILGEVSTRYCIDRSRVFSTGHSFGGYMSNHVACHRSTDVRAIAPVAGGGPYGTCGGPVAAWIAHGNSDTVVMPSEGQGSRDHWLATNGCGSETQPGSPSLCQNYAGCGATPVVWCPHDEQTQGLGGHGWPSFAGTSIWAFFAQF